MKYRVNDAENIRLFIDTVSEICENPKVQSMREIMQHGDTSCLLHSLAVAYFSLYFVTRFHIGCDKKSLIRGALLHDYFLYDWHIKATGTSTSCTASLIPVRRFAMQSVILT